MTTYTFDADGNQVATEEPSGDVTTQTWNTENKLVQVVAPAADVVTYAYSPVNRFNDVYRVTREVGEALTQFLWDNQNILLEQDELGTIEAAYTATPREYGYLLSQHREAESRFYHFDALGSARDLSDEAGVVTDSYLFKAYGQTASSSGSTTNPYQWVGKLGYYVDAETGLHSIRNRHYQSAVGRFVSEDPIGFEGGDSNFYRYVHNNPVNDTDANGLGYRHEPILNHPGRSVVYVMVGCNEKQIGVHEGSWFITHVPNKRTGKPTRCKVKWSIVEPQITKRHRSSNILGGCYSKSEYLKRKARFLRFIGKHCRVTVEPSRTPGSFSCFKLVWVGDAWAPDAQYRDALRGIDTDAFTKQLGQSIRALQATDALTGGKMPLGSLTAGALEAVAGRTLTNAALHMADSAMKEELQKLVGPGLKDLGKLLSKYITDGELAQAFNDMFIEAMMAWWRGDPAAAMKEITNFASKFSCAAISRILSELGDEYADLKKRFDGLCPALFNALTGKDGGGIAEVLKGIVLGYVKDTLGSSKSCDTQLFKILLKFFENHSKKEICRDIKQWLCDCLDKDIGLAEGSTREDVSTLLTGFCEGLEGAPQTPQELLTSLASHFPNAPWLTLLANVFDAQEAVESGDAFDAAQIALDTIYQLLQLYGTDLCKDPEKETLCRLRQAIEHLQKILDLIEKFQQIDPTDKGAVEKAIVQLLDIGAAVAPGKLQGPINKLKNNEDAIAQIAFIIASIFAAKKMLQEGEECPADGGEDVAPIEGAADDCPPKCDSKKLRRETKNHCGIPQGVFCEAHHIIPCKLFPNPIPIRLCKLGFDLNGKENGVMLPCCEYEGRKAAYHKGTTPQPYIDEVERRLAPLDNLDDDEFLKRARRIVADLREELCVGNTTAGLPLNNDANIKPCDKRPAKCTAGCG